MAEPRPERKIIIIPAKKESPQEQAKKRNLRVAAYCRVSTGDEEQLTSYENQKAFYTEKIMKNPDWTMVDIFADEGITGTSTCRRKQFLRMIRQCRQGKIDMILAKSVSRFARNTLDTISYTRELRGLGIAVIFEEQNINSIYPESEFLIALHAAFAQSESESISANVRWGKRQSIKDGKVTFQYRTRQIQRQVCTQRTAVLRGMRHSLPTRRMDTARRKARGMALHEPPGLWKEILPAFSDAGRGASPTGHTERRQFCHVRSRHSDRAAY